MSNTRRIKNAAAEVLRMVVEDNDDFYETDVDSDHESDDMNVQSNISETTIVGDLLEAANISDHDEEDNEIESDHDTDPEILLSENDVDINDDESSEAVTDQAARWYGKDKTEWSKTPLRAGRTPAHNIVTMARGLKGNARQSLPKKPLDCWNLIITEDMLQHILIHTNHKIHKIRSKYQQFTRRAAQTDSTAKKSRPCFVSDTDIDELRAFLGLLYLQGVFKSGHEDLRSLWATDGTGRDIFRCTMSLARFSFLLSCIRFDDEATRRDRVKENKLAAISEIFQSFVDNACANYSPGDCLTVDEMLVPFRGRCGFRMYIPSKPAKYGIKVQILADATTHYMVQAEVYTGAPLPGTRNESVLPVPAQTVMRLVAPVLNTNRNITGDNWYTSVQLVDELRKVGLTYVGTVKKNKRQIPTEFLPSRTREVQSSVFGFQKDKMIVSYVPKKNRSVILMSSMHHGAVVDEESKKPEIILFYNDTKAGVDALDQKCSLYSTSRRTRRWPMAVFHAILNIAGVNSQVIYSLANPQQQKLPRPEYLKQLGLALARPCMERRIGNSKIPRKLRSITANILGLSLPRSQDQPPDVPRSKRKRCSICPPSLDRKTSNCCIICKSPVCQQCAELICPNCS